MACTTVLVGKNASFNGSTMISRNDDDSSGTFTEKNYNVVLPDEQPRLYRSVISHVEIPLPEDPMRYTAMPNSDPKEKGIWAAAGVNADNIAMTATETLTTNSRVLAADPYVEYVPATETHEEIIGGIGEEDIVVLVLPYIHSAREGVARLGALLEEYGTYEPNGIAFSDEQDVWYMETIGGHHWIARRLPDDCYAVIANQFSLDRFDLDDAVGEQRNYMASADIKSFIADNHLDLSFGTSFNARLAFGSHTDVDHIYDTPRVWYGQRYFNPSDMISDGTTVVEGPESDTLPWCRRPEFKITVDDVKTVLSSNYQGTPYDPYMGAPEAGKYRPIGINRTCCTALLEIRPGYPKELAAVEWIAFGSNAYNTLVPQYPQISHVPDYFKYTPREVSTDSFYWMNRLIAALADPSHVRAMSMIIRYREAVGSRSRGLMEQLEREVRQHPEYAQDEAKREAVNQKIADLTREETNELLSKVLYQSSMAMRNAFSLNDR